MNRYTYLGSIIGVSAMEDEFAVVEADVKKVGDRVSPWLWILSVVGFLMAMRNTYIQHKVYGIWKAVSPTTAARTIKALGGSAP